ncbi:glycoside hydrolase family 2 TIM barrel-domain containing protein [Granulicella tundricola]|uniref:Beta-galactosidase n=1 Tax=Granulicella tundricola (strain ATCC BAA-1859 / DSM 23138 / MP5ACTX9) TaxID=1198114 RepID=E8X0G7_GRATM|nr:glycoside hydrolase family 2 TIM barrel-domain containing protein [Granulicella tundricola]ADW67831.1 Beta-galactosidase [Granulicella tundricola MP5ACTX9]
MEVSRRSFLVGSAAVCAATGLHAPLLASVLQSSDDARNVRLEDGWEFYKGPLDGRFQVWHSEELVTWQKIAMPHCFNAYDACDPDTPAYRGVGWYRMKLKVTNPSSDGRTVLHFEGAGQRSEVWIGNERVGSHSGGYDEFVVDITDACAKTKGAEVQLAVRCDNERDIERMPSDLSDFTLYGGLYRAVHLVYLPAVSLEAVHTRVEFEPGKVAKIAVNGRLYGTGGVGVVLRLSLFDPQGKRVFEKTVERRAWTGEETFASFDLPQPQLWSTKTPSLYRCEVELNGVTVAHRFGVRHTRWEDHGPFFLNGERLAIRGTQRHEDHAGYAAAMPEELIRQEIRLMKEMGANFLRLAHYQQSRVVLEMCDELGIMVWEEVPWCRSGVGTKLFQERGKTQLTNMIDQHRNHACVVIWGLGNEDDWPGELNGEDHAAIRAYMTELRELSHKMDPERMTGYRRCDFAKDIPDVYSPSIWAGWYGGVYTEYKATLEKARPTVKHLLHVEWGADSHAGRHAEEPDAVLKQALADKDVAEKGLDYKLTGGAARVSKDGTWSETYACDLFDWYLKTLEELPWLPGAVQWVFKDFTTPLRVDNPVPRVNQKGLLTRDMVPKEGYFVFQSYWGERPMVRVYGHDWPVRWGKVGQERMVRVYSNCAEVELFLNGKSVGKKKRNAEDFPAAGLRWNLAFAAGKNELRAVGVGGVADTVSFEYQSAVWGKAEKLVLAVKSKGSGGTTVEALLLDAAGVRCLDSRAVVRFSLAGDGVLKDNLGTPTGSRVVQMYNGRAEITVAGTGMVGVVSDGVTAGFVAI